MRKLLPDGVQTVFISSVTGMGIANLKDLIWEEINTASKKIVEINHRPMYITPVDEPDEEEVDFDEEEDDDDEDLSKYKGIGWDEL